MTEKERLEAILYESPELLHKSLYGEAEAEKLLDRLLERGVRVPRWIPVTERLPDEKGEYLVAFHPCWWDNVQEDKTVVGTDTFRGKTTWAKKKFQRVTHWMPLPKPPEK